jgi:hypothetical protein
MGYKLRYVQIFKQEKAKQYLEIEKQFEKYELENPKVPKGKRFIPCSGRDAMNTLIWECDFSSLEEAQKAQAFFLTDSTHEALFQTQAEFIVGTFTEIYRPFDS